MGYSYIKFFMTSIDYGENLAEQVGIPGVNLNEVTSAFSQIQFEQGGSRNLGANGNQPLITNLGNLQILDNVTHIRGRHTFKAGRQRDPPLARDPERGQHRRPVLLQPQPDLQLRGPRDRLHGQRQHRLRRGELPARHTRAAKNRTLFDAETYMEKRPEWAAYIQDDFRVTPKLTLNLGLRWDMFVPWVEEDNRQSNYDPSTGLFVVASDDAVINGVKVGPLPADLLEEGLRSPLRLRLRPAGDGRTTVRGGYGVFWNWGVGGTSSSKATNPPFLQATDLQANGARPT